jgi:predicted phage tail component-like protein
MFTFTYKGTSSQGLLKVLKVTRSVLPPSQLKTLEVDGRSGAYFISKKHGIKRIAFEVALISNSETDLRSDVRTLADFLDADKPEALVCSDEPDKTDFAILDGETDLDEIVKVGFGTINFICPDPYSQGNTIVTKNLVAGSNSVTYNGTAPVYPTMTVTFTASVTSFEISNGTKKMHIDASMGTTSTLVIDCNTGKITINNVLNLQTITLDSDFFPLVKGTQTLTVSAYANVTLSYKERFK